MPEPRCFYCDAPIAESGEGVCDACTDARHAEEHAGWEAMQR